MNSSEIIQNYRPLSPYDFDPNKHKHCLFFEPSIHYHFHDGPDPDKDTMYLRPHFFHGPYHALFDTPTNYGLSGEFDCDLPYAECRYLQP
jgi:hypothetical protein